MTNKLDEAKAAWQRSSGRFKQITPTRIAYMGDGQGSAASNLIVSEDPTKIYARRSLNDDRFFVVQSKFIQPAFNKPVILGFTDYEPDIEQVLDYHNAGFITETGASTIGGVGPHHLQHEFGGGDEVFIDPRLLLIGLAKPTIPASMQIYITPFTYFHNEWSRFAGANTQDLTSFVPATDNRYVLIALDPTTGELVYRPGTTFPSSGGFGGHAATISGGMGSVPPPAGDEIPLAAVLLSSTTTELNWNTLVNNIEDTRLFLNTPLKDIRDRLEALEGLTGNTTDLPVTGVQTQGVGDSLANAWALQGYQITKTAPTTGSFLAWDVSQNSWTPSGIPAGLGGEANTGANIGTGFEVFREKSGTTLNFRTIVPGAGVNIASSTSLVTITASAGGGETNTGENLGSGIGVFREKTGVNLLFKSLSPGNYTTLSSGASEITIGSEAEPNTAANLGAGIEVFREKSNITLNLRTLVGGDNTTITSGTSIITIAGTDASNTGENLGVTGYPIFREVSGTSLLFRQLVPGTGVNLASAASTVTITASAGGTGSATNLGSGVPIFKELANNIYQFKSLSAGPNIEILAQTSTIDIKPPERMFNEVVSASAWNNLTIPIWQIPKASNIAFNQFDAAVAGTANASLAFNIQKRDWGSLITAGENAFSSNQTATAGGIRSTTFNGNASIFVTEQHVLLTTGSGAVSGGTVDFLTITGYYNFTTASPAAGAAPTNRLLIEIGDDLLLETSDGLSIEN
jgi:hypothetical protein